MSRSLAGRVVILAVSLALAVGSCGRSTSNGGKAPQSPDGSPVLARVGDYLVTAKQVEERIRTSVGEKTFDEAIKNPDVIQIALSALIDQLAWGEAARAAGYTKDINIRRAVWLYETELLGRAYLGDTVEKQTAPTEQEIQEFYEKYKDHYMSPIRVSVRHIQCATRDRAEAALRRVLNGDDFAQVAREMSEDQATKELGGALGFVSEQEGVLGLGKDRNFLSAALRLQPGETSPAIESSRAWHVIHCEAREGGELKPIDDVRDDIVRRIQVTGKISDTYNNALADVRKKYHAEIIQEAVDAYTGVNDSVERLWGVVDMQPNDRAQVEVLRRIAFDFPKHPLADDAQLRIAYIYACRVDEPRRAEKALGNMITRFPDSELIPAARWLRDHLKDKEITSLSFEDLKARKNH